MDASATAKEALAAMHGNRKGCVVLIREGKPAGILTESHIVRLLDKNLPLEPPAISICVRQVVCANENRPIDFAFEFLSKNRIRRIVLTDDRGLFRGVVLQEDLFAYLDKDVYKIDLKLSDVLDTEHDLVSLDKEESVREALSLMRRKGVGSVVITDENGRPVGIVTEKDILELAYQEEDPKEPLHRHMSAPLFTREPAAPVTEVIDVMKERGFRRVVVVDSEGFCLGVLTDRDILRQIRGNYTKMLQSKIRHAQEIMNMLPEAIMEIFDTKEHQVIHWMNKKAIEIFGADLIDKEIHHLFPPSEWRSIYEGLGRESALLPRKMRIGERIFEISSSASQNYRNRYIKLVFNDVTDHETAKRNLQRRVEEEMRKRLEQEHLLMQQSKLATMGEMIGHIAHQWRQPLAQIGGIFMNLDAAATFGELSPEYLHEKVKRGNILLKHMSQTIEDFRRFFEPGQEKTPFELHTHIRNAISIIEASLTYHHIKIDFTPPERSVVILGYPSEFSQVMLNLIGNAKDVLVERKIENPFIRIILEESGEKVFIRVRDNGGGIEEKDIERIFDPYYTTRKQKDGTGLGLYISRLIIESKIGGKIYANNTEEGAEFVIETEKTLS
jgi:CBS domain-containing protein/signal transduction histidine kinase